MSRMTTEGSADRGKCVRKNMAYPEGVIPGLQNIDVMPGISLSILNTVQDYDASASMERDGRSVEFSYVLSGRAKAISR